MVTAFGTQNYECQPANSLGRVGWVLFTPLATLFDDGSQQLTTSQRFLIVSQPSALRPVRLPYTLLVNWPTLLRR